MQQRSFKVSSRARSPRRPRYIVHDDWKFVYFVVQKVACTSIKTALLPLFDTEATGQDVTEASGQDVFLEDGTPRLRVHKLFDRSGYQINKEQLTAKLNGEYQQYFKFAFVRNPWDRLVSCYCEKLTKNGSGLNLPADVDIELYAGMPFAEFVEAVCEIPDDQANPHFRSQHTVICGRGEDRTPIASLFHRFRERDKPIMADFVGRYENLAADFSVVAERIGGTQKLQLPHILRSKSRKSRPYTEFYDARLKKLVYERYQEDIEIFGYSY